MHQSPGKEDVISPAHIPSDHDSGGKRRVVFDPQSALLPRQNSEKEPEAILDQIISINARKLLIKRKMTQIALE